MVLVAWIDYQYRDWNTGGLSGRCPLRFLRFDSGLHILGFDEEPVLTNLGRGAGGRLMRGGRLIPPRLTFPEARSLTSLRHIQTWQWSQLLLPASRDLAQLRLPGT